MNVVKAKMEPVVKPVANAVICTVGVGSACQAGSVLGSIAWGAGSMAMGDVYDAPINALMGFVIGCPIGLVAHLGFGVSLDTQHGIIVE